MTANRNEVSLGIMKCFKMNGFTMLNTLKITELYSLME